MKAGLSQLLMGAAGGRPIRKRAVGIGVSRAFQGQIRRVSRLKSPTSLYRPALSGIGGASVAAHLPMGLLGRSQAVRQRILIPPFGGSIPPAPARYYLVRSTAYRLGGFFILNAAIRRVLNACCQLGRGQRLGYDVLRQLHCYNPLRSCRSFGNGLRFRRGSGSGLCANAHGAAFWMIDFERICLSHQIA